MPTAQVRAEAAKAMEGFEEPEVAAAHWCRCSRTPTPKCAQAAADTLAELKEARNGALLLDASSSADPCVQAAAFRAVRAAARARRPSSRRCTALDHPSPQVRREAIGVLGYLKNAGRSARSPASRRTIPTPKCGASRSARSASRPTSKSLPALTQRALRHVLAGARGSRQHARQAEAHRRVPDLVRAMDDATGRCACAPRAASAGSRRRPALPALTAALSHEISNLRKEAVIALGEIGDPTAIPPLEARARRTPIPTCASSRSSR